MGYSVYDRGGRNSEAYVATLIADEAADLVNINKNDYAPGTAVLVLEDSSVYMLNSNRTEWVLLGAEQS